MLRKIPRTPEANDGDGNRVKSLTIPVIIVPGKDAFKGYVSEDDLADLAKRDRKTIIALSIIVQWQNWTVEELVRNNERDRYLEEKTTRLEGKVKVLEDQAEQTKWKL